MTVYAAVSTLIRSPEDVTSLVIGLGEDLYSQGVGYAEVTVTPTTHLHAGIPADELAGALDIGSAEVRQRRGVQLGWVYDINAAEGLAGATVTLQAALRHPPGGMVGFGIGGPEAGVRRADFAEVFRQAKAAGLHSVPHAGETVGPSEIWTAVRQLGAERIGHGVSAVTDPRLMEYLRHHKIALEVCPTSNLATGAVRHLGEHPLPALVTAGIPVTIGSDDPPMFATSLLKEYQRARDVLGLTRAQLYAIARTGIEVSFAPDSLKQQLRCTLATEETTRSAQARPSPKPTG